VRFEKFFQGLYLRTPVKSGGKGREEEEGRREGEGKERCSLA
jgi:hypothetical protein